MNTIPLIFNERQINRTVLGGTQSGNGQMDVSVILLNSTGIHFRYRMLENLVKCGFASIVSLETNTENYSIDDLISHFPSVKFIVPQETVTDGDMINIGMSEVKSSYVLVLRDTLEISSGILLPRLALHLTENEPYCIVPRLMTNAKQGLPVQFIPMAEKSRLTVLPSSSVADNIKTLYPFNGIALYHREKFVRLGGFDYTISSPYWQNLDLALRAWLWGEQIRISTAFQINYADKVPVEDSTPDLSHLRFYLKNLLPRYRIDHGVIPASSFMLFWHRSSCGFFETVRQFSDASSWVDKNKYRFKMDAKYLVENWDSIK